MEIAYTMGHQDTRNLARYVRKSLAISQKVILSSPALKRQKPVSEMMEEARRALRELTKYHPDFDPTRVENIDLSVLLRRGDQT